LSDSRTTTRWTNPLRQTFLQSNGASARRKRMSGQVRNMSTVGEPNQVIIMPEMATPTSASSSDKLLSRIAILLFILVAGLLTVFGYYASSICITVVLAGFLAILFDPLVVKLERLHIPRSGAAAGIVLAGIGLIGLLGYALYGRAMSFAEELPVYASTIQQSIQPISRKIQNFQQSAGNLTNDVHPAKRVPEVRLQESPTWPDYLVRGVGSVWGALIIAGVVPFLTFFMLCTKDQMAIRTNGLFSSRIDAARFITNLNQMIHGFVAGNLIVGSVMALATTLVLWSLGVKGAIPLGIASGLLNLLPFLGLIAALALPLAAALLQFSTPGPYIVITLDDSLPACRVGESSDSEIYCQSREYRAGGCNGWDSILGLVVGCNGLAARCTAHRIHQASRGFASVLMSLVEHAGADAASDSALGALQRNGFGAGNSLLAPSRGKSFYRTPTLGDCGTNFHNRRGPET
jgi:predicted PurR-regulated permease PerM